MQRDKTSITTRKVALNIVTLEAQLGLDDVLGTNTVIQLRRVGMESEQTSRFAYYVRRPSFRKFEHQDRYGEP
jgi:hypothetical protein